LSKSSITDFRILGIDPGLATTGFGVIKICSEELQAVEFGCFHTKNIFSLAERLNQIRIDFTKIIAEYRPNVVAVEKIFFAKNVKTAGSVWQARGVILAEAISKNLPVFEYSPNEIKMVVTSFGHADKLQVKTMLKSILKLSAFPAPDDAADALAAAVCYYYSERAKRVVNGKL